MPDNKILNLEQLSSTQLAPIKYILTDVDDTLTWESDLPTATYQAMSNLIEAGYVLIPVTGGCAGWSDLMARIWPVSRGDNRRRSLFFTETDFRKIRISLLAYC